MNHRNNLSFNSFVRIKTFREFYFNFTRKWIGLWKCKPFCFGKVYTFDVVNLVLDCKVQYNVIFTNFCLIFVAVCVHMCVLFGAVAMTANRRFFATRSCSLDIAWLAVELIRCCCCCAMRTACQRHINITTTKPFINFICIWFNNIFII